MKTKFVLLTLNELLNRKQAELQLPICQYCSLVGVLPSRRTLYDEKEVIEFILRQLSRKHKKL